MSRKNAVGFGSETGRSLSHTHARTQYLTGNVPQLQSHHRLVIPIDHFEGEIYSDGGAVMLGENLVHVARNDGGLPDAKVADDQNFEQTLVLHRKKIKIK